LILPAVAKLAGLALSLRLWPLAFSLLVSRPVFYCIQSSEKNTPLEANPIELYRRRNQGLEWLAQRSERV
jgi:hypothetical protein